MESIGKWFKDLFGTYKPTIDELFEIYTVQKIDGTIYFVAKDTYKDGIQKLQGFNKFPAKHITTAQHASQLLEQGKLMSQHS